MSAPNFAKAKSTEVSGTKGKGRSTGVQNGQMMAGNEIKSEYEYLRLQQLKAEIKDKGDAGEEMKKLKDIIRSESEQEILARQILVKLNQLSDYSADFAQISSVLGTTNRTEIAQEMSQKYCDNYSTKIIMDRLVEPNNELPNSVQSAFKDTKFLAREDPWKVGVAAAGSGSSSGGTKIRGSG